VKQNVVTREPCGATTAELRQRALDFSRDWKDASRENADAKPFWVAFFEIFGIKHRRVASFEHPVKKVDGRTGFIDLLWPGVILIEHKSRGEDLDKAMVQAKGYLSKLPTVVLPQFILLCDFERFRLEDLDSGNILEFTLDQLPDRVGHFSFFFGDKSREFEEQAPITIAAVDALDELHIELAKAGYTGHDLEVFLVRLLYCLFAEDTGIFAQNQFTQLMRDRTAEDGSDLGATLSHLFQILNTPAAKRQKGLPDHLNFPYINGQLFAEPITIPMFDASMRKKLVDCSKLDWSFISPAIFGALFQGIMDKVSRRQGGAHYTSERNILKVIEPLFLDALWQEFEDCKANIQKLKNFHVKLSTLNFLDPACGCGNFLVVTYRELRLLELEVIQELHRAGHLWTKSAQSKVRDRDQMLIDAADASKVDVNQFHGIEIDEFPVQIARVAMWLTDHLENRRLEKTFGKAYARIPLVRTPNIIQGNALQIDWTDVLPAEQCTAVMGNPPFVGRPYRDNQQNIDMSAVAGAIPKWRSIDYVANWHIKALAYIKKTTIQVGLVSTNSICQGEQVSALWPYLLEQGLRLNFAHRTFAWENEAKGKAGVHCVILGFSVVESRNKQLWSYDDSRGEPELETVRNISPYLVPGPNIIVHPRSKPISPKVTPMIVGSQATDDGNYLFTPEQKTAFLLAEPSSVKFFHPCIGAEEFLNAKERWCLWLSNADPSELRKMPEVLKRIEAVKVFRSSSPKQATRADAGRSAEWQAVCHTGKAYIAVPRTSSERRHYIPAGFIDGETVATDNIQVIPEGTLYEFGVISSAMHNAWMRLVSGRLKSDYRYGAKLTYNTFPWPDVLHEKRRADVEAAAQAVLHIRAKYPKASLADLYDPRTMPVELLKAHAALDKAIDLCYRSQPFADEAKRVEFLLEMYAQTVGSTDKPPAKIRPQTTTQESNRNKL